MLQVQNVSKKFDDSLALDQLSCTIPLGASYGIVGSNGAGKSTLLRLLVGIYKPDEGAVVLINEQGPLEVYENPLAKEHIILVPDELFFLAQSTLNRMARLYKNSFPHFDSNYFQALVNLFQLDPKKPIRTFSKGMKRQAAIILALATKPRYLLLDEAFDGLDPTMRDLVRKILARDIAERNTTVVISSHSLRELEDTCQWLALLHQGKLIFESRKIDLMEQAPDGLEALFVDRLKAAGYSFDNALEQIYAQQSNPFVQIPQYPQTFHPGYPPASGGYPGYSGHPGYPQGQPPMHPVPPPGPGQGFAPQHPAQMPMQQSGQPNEQQAVEGLLPPHAPYPSHPPAAGYPPPPQGFVPQQAPAQMLTQQPQMPPPVDADLPTVDYSEQQR